MNRCCFVFLSVFPIPQRPSEQCAHFFFPSSQVSNTVSPSKGRFLCLSFCYPAPLSLNCAFGWKEWCRLYRVSSSCTRNRIRIYLLRSIALICSNFLSATFNLSNSSLRFSCNSSLDLRSSAISSSVGFFGIIFYGYSNVVFIVF